MKEIALKKQAELENIYARAHIEINTMAANDRIMTLIDSGDIEPTELLVDMDDQILRAKEEALSRKEILDRVEKWMSTCEEESWLEDYNRVFNKRWFDYYFLCIMYFFLVDDAYYCRMIIGIVQAEVLT